MPKGLLFYEGNVHKIELAVTSDGSCPAKEFLDRLSRTDRERISRIIIRLADFGKIHHREQFKKLEEDFFEFKFYQVRMPCYFHPDGRVIITHGFIKKGDRIDRGQIIRMKRIREEFERRV